MREFLSVYVIKYKSGPMHMCVSAFGSILASVDLPISGDTRRNDSAGLNVAEYLSFELGHVALCLFAYMPPQRILQVRFQGPQVQLYVRRRLNCLLRSIENVFGLEKSNSALWLVD